VRKALIFRCAAVLALAAVTSFAHPPKISVAQELKTLKERLSDKASDDQRVDNCRVPPERRGTTPRADCATQPRPPTPAVQMGTPATR
jgi:hypothetical protein